jgi:hypothetical protein
LDREHAITYKKEISQEIFQRKKLMKHASFRWHLSSDLKSELNSGDKSNNGERHLKWEEHLMQKAEMGKARRIWGCD